MEGPLEVSFRHPPGHEGRDRGADMLVGWTSGCNDYGLLVEVAAHRLQQHEDDPDGPEGTLIGCDPAMTEQEVWLTEFFIDAPRWERDGGVLTLATNDVEIELEEGSRASG